MIGLVAAAAVAALAPQPASFEVASVDPGLRTLTVLYERSSCARGAPEVSVRETRRAVELSVLVDTLDGCSGSARHRRFTVGLRRPVRGRRIEGTPRIEPGIVALRRRTAPRVVDLNLGDAQRAARVQGFRTRRIGRAHGTVAFQSPLPNTRATRKVIRLTVGPDLFPRHALTRCMERSGRRALAARPRPGDVDAPDLALQVRDPVASAFVGFYADRARARALAPRIRRAARRFDGIVERRRHFTVIWTAQPPADLREHVLRCAQSHASR